MAEYDFDQLIEEIKKQLDSSKQNWLFGAGISCESNIPLMHPLTVRVKEIIHELKNPKAKEIYTSLEEELLETSHIEHYLSHIGDLIALADRAKTKTAKIGSKSFKKEELLSLHGEIINAIGNTVRYGYQKKDKDIKIGSPENPIVDIDHHINFVQSIFSSRAGLLSRSKLTFFTTNYDTLLEDALGLEKITVIDGFSGGAMAYWNPRFEFQNLNNTPNKCLVYKLHGSIDWQRNAKGGIIRARYGTNYLKNKSDIMIYPQATKYVETQKDPFSYLFNGFRNELNSVDDNVLITCGYSFGDAHINAEIEAALSSRENRTTLVAFAKECPRGDGVINNTVLDHWLTNPQFGNRIYVAGQKGIYYNSTTPIAPEDKHDLNWWKFSGLTSFISTGEHE